MKKAILILFTLSVVFSCKKANELEDVSLENLHDVEVNNYIEVKEVEEITCDIIKMKLQVNENLIPDTINYTHILIKTPKNGAFKTAQTERVFVKATCTTSTRLQLTLFDETTGLESFPSVFDYEP